MKARCTNCGTIYEIPTGHAPSQFYCSHCGNATLTPVQERPNKANMTAGGLLGGAAIGGMIGGPPGALLGALIGAIIGDQASK